MFCCPSGSAVDQRPRRTSGCHIATNFWWLSIIYWPPTRGVLGLWMVKMFFVIKLLFYSRYTGQVCQSWTQSHRQAAFSRGKTNYKTFNVKKCKKYSIILTIIIYWPQTRGALGPWIIRAWSADSKIVRYVLLRPRRLELDCPDVEVSSASSISNFQFPWGTVKTPPRHLSLL
jgi:hypothetical protein